MSPLAKKKKTTAVVVRNLPVEIHERIKRRAKARGISTESEIRTILKNAVQPEERLNPAELLIEFGKKYGELPYEKDRTPIRMIEFE